MTSSRNSFNSKIGIILATAGSAVGLGNIWRFPYLVGNNGGAAFLLIYIACIFLLGIPGMIAEFIVGRYGKANAVKAYQNFSGSKAWSLVGALGVLTSIIILGFYAVVAGWCIQFLYASIVGELQGNVYVIQDYFALISANPFLSVFNALLVLLLTHIVITRGVRRGIERASKIFMPILLVLLVILVVASISLPDSMKGVDFLFNPDFSTVNGNTILEALGQAFFSLSLGTACLCTYASYFKPSVSLLKTASQTALIDTIIALLAGLIIFPAAFSVGVDAGSGPSLVFITIPNVFQQAFSAVPLVGRLMSILFYLLLILAALTSTISMHEIGTAFFHEQFRWSRQRGAMFETLICAVLAVVSALSVGACPNLKVMGMSAMNFFDSLTAQTLLPLGALLTFFLVGWFASRKVVEQEFIGGSPLLKKIFPVFLFVVRYACPLSILLIFLHQLEVI